MSTQNKPVVIFTDSSRSERQGGKKLHGDALATSYGWIALEIGAKTADVIELFGKRTQEIRSSNDGELVAVRDAARKYSNGTREVHIFTDCGNFVDAYNAYHTGTITPRAMKFLIKHDMLAIINDSNVFIHLVKGHSGSFFNELVDKYLHSIVYSTKPHVTDEAREFVWNALEKKTFNPRRGGRSRRNVFLTPTEFGKIQARMDATVAFRLPRKSNVALAA